MKLIATVTCWLLCFLQRERSSRRLIITVNDAMTSHQPIKVKLRNIYLVFFFFSFFGFLVATAFFAQCAARFVIRTRRA